MPLDSKPVEYPKNIEDFLQMRGFTAQTIDATTAAAALGNYRAANTILLGAISEHTGIAHEHWHAVMKESLNLKIVDLNLKAFEKGKELVSVMKGSTISRI